MSVSGCFFDSSTLPVATLDAAHRQTSLAGSLSNEKRSDTTVKSSESGLRVGLASPSSAEVAEDPHTIQPSGPSYPTPAEFRSPGPTTPRPNEVEEVQHSTSPAQAGVLRKEDLAETQKQVVTGKTAGDQAITALGTASSEAQPTGLLPQTNVDLLKACDRADGAQTVHLPTPQDQEERLKNLGSHRKDQSLKPSPDARLFGDRLSAEVPDVQLHRGLSRGNKDTRTEPHSPPTLHHEFNSARAGSAFESPIDVAHSDVATRDSPFTPDEQLRLEEAQSVQARVNDPGSEQPRQYSNALVTPQTQSTSYEEGNGAQPASRTDAQSQLLQSFRGAPQNMEATREETALRRSAFPGVTGDIAKDITFSQRPPMRIDTGLSQMAEAVKVMSTKKAPEHSAGIVHTPPDSATSARASHASTQPQSPPERMTTRVSSGALRHKSVSEILGETPKAGTQHPDRVANERTSLASSKEVIGMQSPRSSISMNSPDPATFRLRLNELKDKEKSKLSTVIFARKQQPQLAQHPENLRFREAQASDVKVGNNEYFLPLFNAQAATPPQSQLLNKLIGTASKTLTTANYYMDFHEQQDCRILTRIQHLQNANRWPLRQLERSAEPDRPTTHWDVLLSQMKWLRTDFREEGKWKTVAASSMAAWCAQWVAGSKAERIALQVKARSPRLSEENARRTNQPESVATPELIASAEDDSSDAPDEEMYSMDVYHGSAPAAIFDMSPEMFYFGLEKTPVTEKILQELPLYQPSVVTQEAALQQLSVKPDKGWKASLLPVSKYNDGNLVRHDEGPPRKRSRYHYADLDVEPSEAHSLGDSTPALEPEQTEVALFKPENKPIRDRIHAGHAFRPPSEHVMPSQSFFESRQPSQWTQAEDDELRRLVREYAYNWSLISTCLSMPSMFSSGAERRTPWECFERWIGLEGLPTEMAKTPYFRAYHQRLQAAQTNYDAQQQTVQQRDGGNAPHLPLRRRSTQPHWVDRRKNNKHVHLVHAMRNLARKREASAKKQEEGRHYSFLS